MTDHGSDQFLQKLERIELRRTKKEFRCGYVDAKEFMRREGSGTGLTDLRVYHGRGQRALSEAELEAKAAAAEAAMFAPRAASPPKREDTPPSEQVRDLKQSFEAHLQELQSKVPKAEADILAVQLEKKPSQEPAAKADEGTIFDKLDLTSNIRDRFKGFLGKVATEQETWTVPEARTSSKMSTGTPKSGWQKRKTLKNMVKRVEVLQRPVEVVGA